APPPPAVPAPRAVEHVAPGREEVRDQVLEPLGERIELLPPIPGEAAAGWSGRPLAPQTWLAGRGTDRFAHGRVDVLPHPARASDEVGALRTDRPGPPLSRPAP